jgi:hypothetical protein
VVQYESGWQLCTPSGISESVWHSGYRWTGWGRPAGQSWHWSQLSQNRLSTLEHYDGNQAKFADWWADLQLYLKGFSELSHEARIITALGFFTKGDTTTWARVKKEEVLADKLRSWEAFTSDVEARFSNPIHAQKALNEIHNFTQGRRQVAEYLDQFKILKTISTVGNDEALYLVKRGLNPHILSFTAMMLICQQPILRS